MICVRCGRALAPDRTDCPVCGPAGDWQERRIGSGDDVLDHETASGPLGPLQDFSLRGEASARPSGSPPARRVTRSGRATRRPAGRARATPSRRPPTPRPGRTRTRPTPELTLTFEERDREASSSTPTTETAFLRRVIAAGLDATLLVGINAGIVSLTLRLLELPFSDVSRLPVVPMAGFLLAFDVGYVVLLTAFGGQTIGKMATRVRVEGLRGERITVRRSLQRMLACLACMIPAGLGFLGLLGRSRRAFQDRLSGTRVVRVS